MSNKTLYDLHMLIINYIETSHKTIKNSYALIVNKIKDPKTYSDQELKKVFESGDIIPFLTDNDVEIFSKNLTDITQKLKEYIDFVNDIQNAMTHKGKAIYEKTEYILNESKKNSLFLGGTPPIESKRVYLEKLKESYDKYYDEIKIYKKLKFSIDENILMNHEYKIENISIIYNYIENMSNILQKINACILNMKIVLLYLIRYISFDKMRIYISFILKIKKDIPKESFAIILKQIKQNIKIYIKNINDNDPTFNKDIMEFKNFLQNIISKAKPSITENIYDKIINILKKNKVNVTTSLNSKLLNTISKYNQPKSTDIDTIHKDIVASINSTRRKNFLADKIKVELHNAVHKSVLSPILSKSKSTSSSNSPSFMSIK